MTYDESTYGEYAAADYDELTAVPMAADTAMATAFLRDLAPPGVRMLELGVGTGRLALPLADAGFEVHGIDASPAMVARLREKAGGEAIPVLIGSFADFDLRTDFAVVFVAWNTFFGLLTQEQQVSCFGAVARHLQPGGVFVVDAFVPDPARFGDGQAVGVSLVDNERVRLDVSVHDPVAQTATSNHLTFSPDGVRFAPVRVRYAWPSELDLMARLAGLRLRERFGGWQCERFTASSTRHVSVYERG